MSDFQGAEPAGHYLPSGEYVDRQPIRAYEPGANGRLSVGNLLRYCELAANLASKAAGFGPQWYFSRGEGWVIFRTTIELGAGIGQGDTTLVLSPDSAFFKYFEHGPTGVGGRR